MAIIKSATAKVIANKKISRRRADGSYPLYIRLRYNGEKYEYSLNLSVFEKEFNFDTNRFKKNASGNLEINEIERTANDVCDNLGDTFSENAFKDKFFGEVVESSTISEYLEIIEKRFNDNDQFGTSLTYRNLRSALDRYKRKLIFTDMTPKNIEKFEDFLRTPKTVSKNTIKACSTATVSLYMRTLRSAFNLAIDDKIVSIDHYPFSNKLGKGYGGKGYIIQTKAAKRKFPIAKSAMIDLINYPSEPKTRLRNSLNYFAFSYYNRGMNLKDMAFLRWTDIKNGRITYIREKTKRTNSEEKEISIAITPQIMKIINEYTYTEADSPYIFPILSPNLNANTIKDRLRKAGKKINTDIRMVAKNLNIARADEIEFYNARHSYANVLKDANRPTYDIKESLAHGRISTTENYLHTLSDALDRNDQLLYD